MSTGIQEIYVLILSTKPYLQPAPHISVDGTKVTDKYEEIIVNCILGVMYDVVQYKMSPLISLSGT